MNAFMSEQVSQIQMLCLVTKQIGQLRDCWVIEVLTNKHRLYFKPMGKLAIQDIGSVAINPIKIYDGLDIEFKFGSYKEIESFINQIDDGKKKTINDQLRYMEYFEKIEGVVY